MRRTPLVALGLAALLFSGCAGYLPVNRPLRHFDPTVGYRPAVLEQQRPLGRVVLMLAFSGGGTRAASFAYGVLQELRDSQLEIDGHAFRLLDEVDIISSVSGGSFTSAYYGLFGERIFQDFEERFLRKNVQGRLYLQILNPVNWLRLFGTFFSRTELAIEYYDDNIFGKATFADLQAHAAERPRIVINATDLSIGENFPFTQPTFDLLCSNLSSFPVARAVAASSAVPGAFAPITLKNFAGKCGYEEPAWVAEALADRRASPRRYQKAKSLRSYLDGSRSYVHLVDGGISDNLGLRPLLDAAVTSGSIYQRLEEQGAERPTHVVVVLVNAETEKKRSFDLTARAPRIGAVLGAVSGVQIARYNFETIELLRANLEDWARRVPAELGGPPMKTYLVQLDFESAPPDERPYFKNLPTSFNLDDEAVNRLIDLGRTLLRTSPEFRGFLDDVVRDYTGELPPPAKPATGTEAPPSPGGA
jgi:NTE family protein